jgi:hypothetical protein
MNAWAEVDNIKLEQRARVLAKDRQREAYRQQRHETAARRNVERWFRELPADMVRAFAFADGDRPGCVLSAAEAIVANDYLLARGLGLKTPRPKRAPSAGEFALIKVLKDCRFPPASFAKRFARELPLTEVTDGQVAQVRRLIHTFRRQIPFDALLEADRHLLARRVWR